MPGYDRKTSKVNELDALVSTDKILVSDADAVTGGQAKYITPDTLKYFIFSGFLELKTATNFTIASDAITLTACSVAALAAAGGPGADDLSTINGLPSYNFVLLIAQAGNTITVKHGVDNIFLNGAADKALGPSLDPLLLYNNGSDIVQIMYSDNV